MDDFNRAPPVSEGLLRTCLFLSGVVLGIIGILVLLDVLWGD